MGGEERGYESICSEVMVRLDGGGRELSRACHGPSRLRAASE